MSDQGGKPPGPTDEEREAYIRIWEKAVDTQMHFNEMSVKARQFGLTFVAGALGLGVVLQTRGQEFAYSIPIFGGVEIHAIVILILASAFAMYAVSLLDLRVYHRMLRGAVYFGEDFEQKYLKQIFQLEKGMTQAISHFSRFDDAAINRTDAGYQYIGKDATTAEDKVRRFYTWSIRILVLAAIALVIITNHFWMQPRTTDNIPTPTNASTSTATPTAAPNRTNAP